MQRSSRRRLVVAVAGALVVHGLLVGTLALWPRGRARKTMQVELVRKPPPAAPRVAAQPPQPPSTKEAPKSPPGVEPKPTPSASEKPGATAKRSATRAPTPSAPASPTGTSTPTPSAPASPTGTTTPSPSATAKAAPTASPPGPATPSPTAPAPRSPGWLSAEGVARPGGGLTTELEHPESVLPGVAPPSSGNDGLVRQKSKAEQLAEEKATLERKLNGWVSDTKARDRAANGRDKYWQGLEDALGHGFEPGWDVLEQGPKEAARSGMGAFIESWKQGAAAYGKSGSPFGGDPDAPGAPKPLHEEYTALANEDRGLGGVSLGGNLTPLPNLTGTVAAALGSGPFHQRLTALIRITQRQDGSLFGVELLGTSGNAAYDRIVLSQARRLSRLQLGPPKQGLETLWAFETEFTQVPPVPIAGCALDDFVPKHCFYPLQRRTHSRVHLQAIY